MTLQFRILCNTSFSDNIWYFIFGYYGILVKRKLTLSNTVRGKPTCKFATFTKFRLVPSKRGIYIKSMLSVLLISVKIYKKNITVCNKTNLNFFLYNVIGLHVSRAIFKNSNTIWQYLFGYYITIELQILYDPTVSDTMWHFVFG